MANHKDAAKRAVQSTKQRARNRTYRTRMRNQISELRTLFKDGKDEGTIQENLRETISVIHRLASKGIIHRNQAARRVARLTAAARNAANQPVSEPTKGAKRTKGK